MRLSKIYNSFLSTSMQYIVLCTLQLVWLVACSATNSGRYLIDSKPVIFEDEPNTESQVFNSTLLLKKKSSSGGPVYFNSRKPEHIISNHHASSSEGAVWRRPQTPLIAVISNHKGHSQWSNKWFHKLSTTTHAPLQIHVSSIKKSHPEETLVINNHKSNKLPLFRPKQPSTVVAVVDTSPIQQQTPASVLGDRLKPPEVVKSAAINILDAPSNLKTTIKHNKIIVIQKRTDTLTSNDVQKQVNPGKPNKFSQMGNFSVAPVMDPWSNIPIPAKPSWAISSPVKGIIQPAASSPVVQAPVGSSSSVQPTAQTVLPNLPFMPFLSSLIMPLLSKPLTSSALNSNMQGIKAMQGFLRNSLMGAMFCFLPSALIALSLTATQRRELRKIPEVDDMMIYCKKCLENLRKIKDVAYSKDSKWLKDDSR